MISKPRIARDPLFLVYGAGGHGRVVLDILGGGYGAHGHSLVLVYDDDEDIDELDGHRVDHRVPGPGELGHPLHFVVAIGSPAITRRDIADCLVKDGHLPGQAIHLTATCGTDPASLGRDVVICAHAHIGPGVSIGDHTIINTHADVEHGTTIGEMGHIAPGVVICGDCTIGHAVLVGAGAVVLPGAVIEDGVTIGAGAVIEAGRTVERGATVMGVPARSKMPARPYP